jgi:hypothetical protein
MSSNKTLLEWNNEKRYACYLIQNQNIINYGIFIFEYIMTFWIKNYPSFWKKKMTSILLEKKNGNIIETIGFTEHELKMIFKYIDDNDRDKLYDYLNDKILKVNAIHRILSVKYTFYFINKNPKLQKRFLQHLKTLFLFDTKIEWNDFEIYKDDSSFNKFLFQILIYGGNNMSSIYLKNLGYSPFIRKNIQKKTRDNLQNISKCNKSIVSVKQDYRKYSIYNAKSIYEITTQLPYAMIMNKFNQPILSGPSGSTALIYIFLFQFMHLPNTRKNKIMLLGLLIGDFVPLWHTIPEILLNANVELTKNEKTISSYHLQENAINYVSKLLKPYI